MTLFILQSEDFATIRSAVDPSLSADEVSDDTIASPAYAEQAEVLVMERDPLWITRVGLDKMEIHRAAILMCASLLAPFVTIVSQERVGNFYQYRREPVDLMALSRILRARAEDALNRVLDRDIGDLRILQWMPIMFGVAPAVPLGIVPGYIPPLQQGEIPVVGDV